MSNFTDQEADTILRAGYEQCETHEIEQFLELIDREFSDDQKKRFENVLGVMERQLEKLEKFEKYKKSD